MWRHMLVFQKTPGLLLPVASAMLLMLAVLTVASAVLWAQHRLAARLAAEADAVQRATGLVTQLAAVQARTQVAVLPRNETEKS